MPDHFRAGEILYLRALRSFPRLYDPPAGPRQAARADRGATAILRRTESEDVRETLGSTLTDCDLRLAEASTELDEQSAPG